MNSLKTLNDIASPERISPEDLHTIFAHTQGMLLSQVSDLCRLEGTTIQNWVKRGLVPPAENKRYDLRTVARILIVDLLRDCLALEHIAFLLSCINGKVRDLSDDLLEEPELYQYLHTLIRELDTMDFNEPDAILELIQRLGPTFDDEEIHERVRKSLQAMLLAYSAVRLKRQAESLIDGLILQYPYIKEQGATFQCSIRGRESTAPIKA